MPSCRVVWRPETITPGGGVIEVTTSTRGMPAAGLPRWMRPLLWRMSRIDVSPVPVWTCEIADQKGAPTLTKERPVKLPSRSNSKRVCWKGEGLMMSVSAQNVSVSVSWVREINRWEAWTTGTSMKGATRAPVSGSTTRRTSGP
jgi:hypothetical protein